MADEVQVKTRPKRDRKSTSKGLRAIEAPAHVSGTTPPPSPPGHESTEIEFLKHLYYAINETAKTHAKTGLDFAQQKSLLRRTRVQRFLRRLPANDRTTYNDKKNRKDRLESVPHDPRVNDDKKVKPGPAGRFINIDAIEKNFQQDSEPSNEYDDERLQQVVDRCGYVTLAVCLFADFFQQYIRTASNEHDYPSWDKKLDAIDRGKPSLELFAKLRHLPISDVIHDYDANFQILMQTFLKGANKITRHPTTRAAIYPTGKNLGITDGEEVEIHDIEKYGPINGHWALPRDASASAAPCDITYRITRDLRRTFPELRVGEERTEFQEDIPDSIVLSKYTWPGGLRTFADNDPRASAFEEICEVCQEAAREGGVRCFCSFKQLQGNRNSSSAELLYELVTTDLGVGVRVLQDVPKGHILDRYLGEIYPYQKHDAKRRGVGERYGGARGGAYHMELEIDAWERRTLTARQRAEGETGTLVRPSRNHYKTVRVDSAVKGNWTRFMNHSCDAACEFKAVHYGQRNEIAVLAWRDIKFGEILTVYYGPDYFGNKPYGCMCRVECCHFWNANDPLMEVRTLGEALEERSAEIDKTLAWIGDLDNFKPIRATEAGLRYAKETIGNRKGKQKRKSPDANSKTAQKQGKAPSQTTSIASKASSKSKPDAKLMKATKKVQPKSSTFSKRSAAKATAGPSIEPSNDNDSPEATRRSERPVTVRKSDNLKERRQAEKQRKAASQTAKTGKAAKATKTTTTSRTMPITGAAEATTTTTRPRPSKASVAKAATAQPPKERKRAAEEEPSEKPAAKKAKQASEAPGKADQPRNSKGQFGKKA